MLLSFELTMPNKGSWNGKWTGDGEKYYIVKNVSNRFVSKQDYFATLLKEGKDSFYYSWNDGWGANVSVRIVDAITAKKHRKESKGFAGYSWMVESIILQGEIKPRKYS